MFCLDPTYYLALLIGRAAVFGLRPAGSDIFGDGGVGTCHPAAAYWEVGLLRRLDIAYLLIQAMDEGEFMQDVLEDGEAAGLDENA
ncbi:hypothetical protein DB032_13270 [Chromobacterium sp. Panama]|nr:hypothetical protein DB032_13270 [Chromobacterium sp. Panama]